MPEYLSPGVYVEETSFRSKSIEGVSTTTTGFVGPCRYGPVDLESEIVTSLVEFERVYGDGADLALRQTAISDEAAGRRNFLWHAVRAFFAEGGKRLYVARAFSRFDNTETAPPDESAALFYRGPDDDLVAGLASERYPDGHARSITSVTVGAETRTLVLRARYPGAYGNFRVRVRIVLGQNLLVGTDTAPIQGALADGDIVTVIPRSSTTTARVGRYRARRDAATGAWSFTGDDNTPRAVGDFPRADYEMRVVTLTVTASPLSDPGREDVWAGLALDAARATGGQPEGITARLGYDAHNPSPNRAIPIVVRALTTTDAVTTEMVNGLGVLSTLAGIASVTAQVVALTAAETAASNAVTAAATAATAATAAGSAAAPMTAARDALVAARDALAAAREAIPATPLAATPPAVLETLDEQMRAAREAAAAAAAAATAARTAAGNETSMATDARATATTLLAAATAARATATTRQTEATTARANAAAASAATPPAANADELVTAANAAEAAATAAEGDATTAEATATAAEGAATTAEATATAATAAATAAAAASTAASTASAALAAVYDPVATPLHRFLVTGRVSATASDVREFILSGGHDGRPPSAAHYEGAVSPDTDRRTGLHQFEDIEDISIVAAPGATADASDDDALDVCNRLIGHCRRMRYRIAVLDAQNGRSIAQVRAFRARMDSSHAALYYPWVRVIDPNTRQPIHLPPSGFVAGIYARNDSERAVYKAPANEVVNLAVGFENMLNKSQQDVLNPEGVNCFRFFEGRGYRLWGARTVSSDPEWKYVNLRRYFAYLERSIERGTQWAVFEPNGEALWANVRRTIEDFLFNEFQSGALLGDRPDKAYFVKCDRSTMTQNDLDNGRLVCLIGVAALRPAEFVIFRIGQWTGDRKA